MTLSKTVIQNLDREMPKCFIMKKLYKRNNLNILRSELSDLNCNVGILIPFVFFFSGILVSSISNSIW